MNELLGVHSENSYVEMLSNNFGCKVGTVPTTYALLFVLGYLPSRHGNQLLSSLKGNSIHGWNLSFRGKIMSSRPWEASHLLHINASLSSCG